MKKSQNLNLKIANYIIYICFFFVSFRRMGRAFMHGVRSVAPGYGLKNLSKGRDDMSITLENKFSRTPVCGQLPVRIECGSYMRGPTLYTADVGQAYEMMKPSIIEDGSPRVFKAFRSTTRQKDPTLSVIHSVKAKSKYAGWISDHSFDRSVFPLAKFIM